MFVRPRNPSPELFDHEESVNTVDQGDYDKGTGAFQADEFAQPQHDGFFPLIRNPDRRGDQNRRQNAEDCRDYAYDLEKRRPSRTMTVKTVKTVTGIKIFFESDRVSE